jgi:hypothetical protein
MYWRDHVCSPNHIFNYCVVFGVLTAVSVKIAVCGDVTPYNLVHRYRSNHQILECLNLSVQVVLRSFFQYPSVLYIFAVTVHYLWALAVGLFLLIRFRMSADLINHL